MFMSRENLHIGDLEAEESPWASAGTIMETHGGKMKDTPIVKIEASPVWKMEETPFRKIKEAPDGQVTDTPSENAEAAPIRKLEETPACKMEEDSSEKQEGDNVWKTEDPVEKVLEGDELQTTFEQPELQRPERPQTTIQGVTLAKMQPGEDPESFLLAFEAAAAGSFWPKEQWAMRLAPFLSEEAYAIYQALPFYTAEDYDQLKEAILDHMVMIEEDYRKKFRSVMFTAGAKPRMVAHKLRDLGRKWLKPEIRSPEEMLERVVIEQFIKILPPQAGDWLTHQNVRTLDRAVQLVEGYLAGEAFGRASKVGLSDVWPSHWDGGQSTEEHRPMKIYPEHFREQWAAGMLEPQEPLSLKTKEKRLQGSETETSIRRWNRYHWRQRGRMQTKTAPSTEHENGIVNSASSNDPNLSPTEGREYSCTECGKSFSHAKYLNSHQQIHRGDKPYRCDECGKSFRESRKLITHQRVHTGERPFKCSECGKGFSQVAHLSSHKRMHTGEKPYTCNECGNHFGHLSTLISHVLIHTGEKPYKCSVCEKGFRRLTDKRRHERTHTGEKPYKCSECGKSFNQSGSLYTHHRIHSIERITI